MPQKIYCGQLHPLPTHSADDSAEKILIKYRFNKQYRHPTLDSTLTKSRIAGEARALIKCLRCANYLMWNSVLDLHFVYL